MSRNVCYDILGTWIILSFILIISRNILDPVFVGRTNQALIYTFFMYLVLTKYIKFVSLYIWIFIISLVFSTLIHYSNPEYDRPMETTVHWIFLILFLYMGCKYYRGKWLLYFLLMIFIVNCLIGFYEKLSLSHLFNYNLNMLVNHERMGDQGRMFFRSFALFGHPLYNANITSIIMAFVLVSNNIGKYIKVLLIIIGILGLISFNSRSSMAIWAIILLFYTFIKYKFSFILLIMLVVLFFTQDIINFFVDNEILGRLSEGLNDSSSETRWQCYSIFALQNWNVESILGGLGIIYYPFTDISLENGVLLTLGYWGWFVGAYKVIIELFLSYQSIQRRYDISEIFIIFLASWGVAFCNNNSFTFLYLSFLYVTIIAFNGFNKLYKSRQYIFK